MGQAANRFGQYGSYTVRSKGGGGGQGGSPMRALAWGSYAQARGPEDH